MDLSNLPGYEQAAKALLKNTSPRAQWMALLEAYVDGTQYAGRPDWFGDEKPLIERAPCIVYPLAKNAIASNVDLVLGEGRWPTLTSRPDEDDEAALEDDEGLGEEASETLDRAIVQVHRLSRFRALSREVLAAAQGARSACVVFQVVDGRLRGDTVKARWCTPVLDKNGDVVSIEIRYPYLDHYFDERERCWKVRALLYRRTIDAERDVTYLPAVAREDAAEPDWKPDPAQSFGHGLGFCPVRWYPFMKGCTSVAEVDGHAIHENLLDEIFALDFTLSVRHRAAFQAGDPQWTEAGVVPGSSPTEVAPKALAVQTAKGGAPSPDNPIVGYFPEAGPPSGTGRKKGSAYVWQYASKDTKVELHTLPGDALEAIDEHASDLRIKIAESLAVVFLDPENVKFAATVSGKALETLRERQLNRCDQIRDDFGDRFIIPATVMMLRIVRTLGKRGKGALHFPGLAKVMPVLERFDAGPTAPAAAA